MPDLGPNTPERAAKAYVYAEGEAGYRQRVLIAWARSGDPPARQGWRGRLALPERWQPPRFPLGGADVLALGLAAGPRIGELLRALEAWWIAGDFVADEAALRAKLEEMART
jgi:poly(A) polymerase